MTVTRNSGTVAKWLNHKGIGFITPEGEESVEGNDILVHFSQLKQETEDGFKSLAAGSKVEFELEADPKDAEKKIAVNVTGIDGADCEARKKGRGKRVKAEKKEKTSDDEEEEEEEGEEKEKPKKSGKGKGKRSSKGKGKGKGKRSKGKGKGKKEKESSDE
jgi:cold shock CspA family protein